MTGDSTMKCPCCHNQMEQGYLQTGQRIAWTKKIHKISLCPQKGEILLANNVFQGAHFQAYVCKQCQKIVLDYVDKEVVEG
jgi:hypothetical protein